MVSRGTTVKLCSSTNLPDQLRKDIFNPYKEIDTEKYKAKSYGNITCVKCVDNGYIINGKRTPDVWFNCFNPTAPLEQNKSVAQTATQFLFILPRIKNREDELTAIFEEKEFVDNNEELVKDNDYNGQNITYTNLVDPLSDFKCVSKRSLKMAQTAWRIYGHPRPKTAEERRQLNNFHVHKQLMINLLKEDNSHDIPYFDSSDEDDGFLVTAGRIFEDIYSSLLHLNSTKNFESGLIETINEDSYEPETFRKYKYMDGNQSTNFPKNFDFQEIPKIFINVGYPCPRMHNYKSILIEESEDPKKFESRI